MAGGRVRHNGVERAVAVWVAVALASGCLAVPNATAARGAALSSQDRRGLIADWVRDRDRFAGREILRVVFHSRTRRLSRPALRRIDGWARHAAELELRRTLGGRLVLSTPAAASVLPAISLVPDATLRALVQAGLSQLRLVHGRLDTDPVVLSLLSGQSAPQKLGSWAEAGGLWFQNERAAVVRVSGRRSSDAVDALHEIGHAVGDTLGLDTAAAFEALYAQIARRLRDPYYLGPDGAREFFAQSFARAMLSPADAEGWYGDAYVDWLRRSLGLRIAQR